MDRCFTLACPYCGELVEMVLEPDMAGSFVQDCEVCCNPWLVRIVGKGEDRWIELAKADGTD